MTELRGWPSFPGKLVFDISGTQLAFYRFFLDRKKVGNFIAGTDTSQSQSTDQQSKQGKHTPLPVDPYYYPGLRFAFHFVTVDVTTVGQSKYLMVGFYATKKNLFIDRYIMINEDMELFGQWINTK